MITKEKKYISKYEAVVISKKLRDILKKVNAEICEFECSTNMIGCYERNGRVHYAVCIKFWKCGVFCTYYCDTMENFYDFKENVRLDNAYLKLYLKNFDLLASF